MLLIYYNFIVKMRGWRRGYNCRLIQLFSWIVCFLVFNDVACASGQVLGSY